VIARTAFDAALGRELHEVIQEAKRMASQIQQSSDQHYLTQRGKEIDRKVRLSVFATHAGALSLPFMFPPRCLLVLFTTQWWHQRPPNRRSRAKPLPKNIE
jgi:hypothetical protein